MDLLVRKIDSSISYEFLVSSYQSLVYMGTAEGCHLFQLKNIWQSKVALKVLCFLQDVQLWVIFQRSMILSAKIWFWLISVSFEIV